MRAAVAPRPGFSPAGPRSRASSPPFPAALPILLTATPPPAFHSRSLPPPQPLAAAAPPAQQPPCLPRSARSAHSITHGDVIPASRYAVGYEPTMAKPKRPRRARAQRPRPRPLDAREPGESLGALRRRVGLTQVELAGKLAASQRAVSHVEHEPNPRVGTLGGYIEALGGRLELRAVFGEQSVTLRLGDSPEPPSR